MGASDTGLLNGGSLHWLYLQVTKKEAVFVNAKRPMALVVAVVLLALLSLGNFPTPFLPGANQIPLFINIVGVVIGIIGLVAIFGLWQIKPWGMIVGISVSVLNALSSLPGIPFGPNMFFQISAAMYVVLSIVIIVLILLPSVRKAVAVSA